MLTQPAPAASADVRVRPLARVAWWLAGIDLLLPALAALWFPPDLKVDVGASDAVSAVPAFVILWALGAMLVRVAKRSPGTVRLYSAAFLLRAFVALVLAYSFQFDDEGALHASAVGGYGGGYARFVGHLYRIFGDNLLVAKAFNVALGALVVVLVGELVADPRRARHAQLLSLVAPPLVIYSSVNLKEAGTALLILAGIVAAIRGWRRRAAPPVAVAQVFGAIFGIWWWRGAPWAAMMVSALTLGFVVAQLFGGGVPLRRVRPLFIMLALLAGVAALTPSLASEVRDNYVSQRSGAGATTSYFVSRTYAEGAGITPYLTPGKELGIRNLVLLWGRGLFVPSPLRVLVRPSGAVFIELANALGWYALLFLAIRGVARDPRSSSVLLMAVSAIAISFATTALTTLGADATRHRVALLPVMCALAVGSPTGGMAAKSAHWARAALWCAVVGAVVYNLLWLRGTLGA